MEPDETALSVQDEGNRVKRVASNMGQERGGWHAHPPPNSKGGGQNGLPLWPKVFDQAHLVLGQVEKNETAMSNIPIERVRDNRKVAVGWLLKPKSTRSKRCSQIRVVQHSIKPRGGKMDVGGRPPSGKTYKRERGTERKPATIQLKKTGFIRVPELERGG